MSTKNRAVLYPKVFYQTDKLICVKFLESRTSKMLSFESIMVWPKKNTEISQKTCSSYLNSDAP